MQNFNPITIIFTDEESTYLDSVLKTLNQAARNRGDKQISKTDFIKGAVMQRLAQFKSPPSVMEIKTDGDPNTNIT